MNTDLWWLLHFVSYNPPRNVAWNPVWTKRVGQVCYVCEMSMTFIVHSLSISYFSACRAFGPVQYDTEKLFLAVGENNFALWSAVLIVSWWTSHISLRVFGYFDKPGWMRVLSWTYIDTILPVFSSELLFVYLKEFTWDGLFGEFGLTTFFVHWFPVKNVDHNTFGWPKTMCFSTCFEVLVRFERRMLKSLFRQTSIVPFAGFGCPR